MGERVRLLAKGQKAGKENPTSRVQGGSALSQSLDNLDFEIELIADDRSAVLDTKTISMTVLPENTDTKAQVIAAANNDNTHFHDNSPTGLLGQNEIQHNRAGWDLVESKISNAADLALIKADLGIPV